MWTDLLDSNKFLVFIPGRWQQGKIDNLIQQWWLGLEGFIVFSRCLHCSKSITSSQAVLRVRMYYKSAWCQARLVTVTAGDSSYVACRDPPKSDMWKEGWPRSSETRWTSPADVCCRRPQAKNHRRIEGLLNGCWNGESNQRLVVRCLSTTVVVGW